jgi:hypothetical protein
VDIESRRSHECACGIYARLDPKSIGPVGSPPGRKMWVHAVLEDGEGGVSIEAESFWLEVNQVKGML